MDAYATKPGMFVWWRKSVMRQNGNQMLTVPELTWLEAMIASETEDGSHVRVRLITPVGSPPHWAKSCDVELRDPNKAGTDRPQA